ncbi:hypothetical protein [Teichococcus aestuarii]|uniref:Uncharacterized protein n=1 Tax=Teichococcus aestuarii TaxID=568898 RepID=A0A2U1UXD8_9PROT|nr:hypothetical protein [Pseudoroseomonas aestuarii]PWC26333.1 hypothetical protein CR165_23800 [Pseudoroseomonas aestuarii]
MIETLQTQPSFLPEGSTFQQILLRCSQDCKVDDEVAAYVMGIRVGQTRLQGDFKVGDRVSVPVRYLPMVELPATIRLSSRDSSVGDVEALVLKTPDAAAALVGPGEIMVERLGFNQGMLRGYAVNRVNGLSSPMLFARLNGLLMRPVAVERPRLLDDGGCSFGFAVQLYPTDMGENGFSIALHVVGEDVPIANFQYMRNDGDEQTKRILALESRLAQAQQMTSLQIAALTSDFRKRLDAQQERIDAFIDYASCLLFDQLAVEPVGEATSLPLEPDESMRARMAAFRQLVYDAPKAKVEMTAASPVHAPMVELPPHSEAYSFGWYDVEGDEAGEFRWMGQIGMVQNPAPARQPEQLTIRLRHVFKVAVPMLRLFLDTQEVEATITPANAPDVYLVEVQQAFDAPPLPHFQTLRIDSFVAGSPSEAEDSTDTRILSVAISSIFINYL